MSENKSYHCDSSNSNQIESNYTYFNDALCHYSVINFTTSDLCKLTCYNVLEPSINVSDHRSIIAHFQLRNLVSVMLSWDIKTSYKTCYSAMLGLR